MSIDQPRVTIITACRNAAATIGHSLESIRSQSYKELELIVIDGASTDRTTDVVSSFSDIVTKFISEPDRGVYDAWNKGLRLATGSIIGFLNADDEYQGNSIETAVATLVGENVTLCYGNVLRKDSGGSAIEAPQVKHLDPSTPPAKLLRGFGFWHVGVFATKDCFDLVGHFDPQYRIAGDFDWLLRAFLAKVSFKRAYTLTLMRRGGLSDKYRLKGHLECQKSMRLNGIHVTHLARIRALIGCLYNDSCLLLRLRAELQGALLATFNAVLRFTPSFSLRRMLLRATGSQVGTGTTVHACTILGNPMKIHIGSGTTVNREVVLDARGRIYIGDNVTISRRASVLTAGHDIDCPAFSYVTKPVKIDDHAVVFSGAAIMPGVTIGRGAVVMAYSVVIKDVPPFTVVGGNPAQVVRRRNCLPHYRSAFPVLFD